MKKVLFSLLGIFLLIKTFAQSYKEINEKEILYTAKTKIDSITYLRIPPHLQTVIGVSGIDSLVRLASYAELIDENIDGMQNMVLQNVDLSYILKSLGDHIQNIAKYCPGVDISGYNKLYNFWATAYKREDSLKANNKECPQWLLIDSIRPLVHIIEKYIGIELKDRNLNNVNYKAFSDPKGYNEIRVFFYVSSQHDTLINEIDIAGDSSGLNKAITEYLIPSIQKCTEHSSKDLWTRFNGNIMIIDKWGLGKSIIIKKSDF